MKKLKKLLQVSIGLSVFNEANNIARVLNEILNQNQENWTLKEVFVYDDGSTDNTVNEIKKVKHKLIKLSADGLRKSKTLRLSEMFKEFDGDILIMFDGDIKFESKNVVTRLLRGFDDPSVMLVGGNSLPIKPKTFIEKSVYSTFSVYYRSRKELKGGNNVFGCTGSILAIRKFLAKKIKLPGIINEDVYIYLYCIKQGFKFRYVDDARIFYKLPDNILDHVKQVFRSTPEAVDIELKKYFDELVDNEFRRSRFFYLKSIYLTFLESPLPTVFIMLVNLLCRPFQGLVSKKYKLSWFTAASTH